MCLTLLIIYIDDDRLLFIMSKWLFRKIRCK